MDRMSERGDESRAIGWRRRYLMTLKAAAQNAPSLVYFCVVMFKAMQLLNKMKKKRHHCLDLFHWSHGYAMKGNEESTVVLVDKMARQGQKPNEGPFVYVASCMQLSILWLKIMEFHQLQGCDFLGCAGMLAEALIS
ncbi:hypothetical protein Nepgr_021835 [Nepenthes gracilis]|uniref:Pentatricopeptide repeat-containing protein n=1 Tax=Nepenthes gracilis TaxID=150966 RepID=A0AAD3XXF7_NEPGR|nr:hypothetical protein Nepgr_021835 [Nepenthes gracilis]